MNGLTVAELMRDGRAILLDFTSDERLKNVADAYQIKYISGDVKDRLELNALLIRPDGIIAWATDKETNVDELQKQAKCWFVNR
jgi:hypothetical protein